MVQTGFPKLQANQEEIRAILRPTGFSGSTSFANIQKLLIYREHEKLNAIFFEPGGNACEFHIQTETEEQHAEPTRM